jgi:hypothetical protein
MTFSGALSGPSGSLANTNSRKSNKSDKPEKTE